MKDAKIVRKLFKDANKIKEMLSANRIVEKHKISEVDGKTDLIFSVTREEFEDKIQPSLIKLVKPLKDILKRHPLNTIDGIEILGGGIRVPLVK